MIEQIKQRVEELRRQRARALERLNHGGAPDAPTKIIELDARIDEILICVSVIKHSGIKLT